MLGSSCEQERRKFLRPVSPETVPVSWTRLTAQRHSGYQNKRRVSNKIFAYIRKALRQVRVTHASITNAPRCTGSIWSTYGGNSIIGKTQVIAG